MELSVLIPTFGRPGKVAACVAALADQTLGSDEYEVLVGVDGGAEDRENAVELERALRSRWPEARADRLRVLPRPKVGQAAVRNELLPLARGSTLVFLNDDMVPQSDLLASHLRAQREQPSDQPALVIGASPWVEPERDSLFDRLIRETSMVFFYDQMNERLATGEVGRDHDWGFRHAWLLNLSAPAAMVRDAGAFSVFPSTYGFEDDELAFRCAERFGARVLYRPEAVARHDHRLPPEDYLGRERRLGYAAWGFAAAAPRCALAMFGRDITSDAELAYSRAYVARESGTAERLRETLVDLAETPADAVPTGGSPAGRVVMRGLYQQHLLLKRWEWRTGLLAAAEDARVSGGARVAERV